MHDILCVLILKKDFKEKKEKTLCICFHLLKWNYKQKWKSVILYKNIVKSYKNIDISFVYLYKRELNLSDVHFFCSKSPAILGSKV